MVGLIAIPLVRAVRSRVWKNSTWDAELEKDVEQWFRSSLVLFLATKNVEQALSAWVLAKQIDIDFDNWLIAAGRLLLAIGVIESMPDQQLFSIIHPGPSRLRWLPDRTLRQNIREQAVPLIKGLFCMHLSRSSPVFAILTVIFGGWEGWVFYALAITQYLFIGLVTSRDKALDVLSRFDEQVARKRQELIEEFEIPDASRDSQPEGTTELEKML